jgi:colicin import membrane protein
MRAAAERFEFAPPPTAGLPKSLGLAVLAHALLLAALTWGISWKRDAPMAVAEAELWSAIPQQAAAKLVEPPPAPPPVLAPPKKVAPAVPDASIALEREKQRLKKEQQEAREKLEQQKLQKEKQAELDKRKEALKAQEEAKKLEAQRQANIQRATGLANATGAATATGSAQQSSGPSASYGGRIQARVRPNIVYPDDIATNPAAEVEVRAAPDGTIIGRTLLKSSGVKSWDDAVLKAIDKTEVLPRDVDGRVPSVIVITFRPKT